MRLTAKSEWPKFRERTDLEKGSRETSRPAKDPLVPFAQHPAVLIKIIQHPRIQLKSPEQHGKGGLRN